MRVVHLAVVPLFLTAGFGVATAQQNISAVAPLVHRDSVEVVGDAAPDASEGPAVNSFTLSGKVLENLSTVLADDPLRAIAAIPGATANDDFSARFALRGADPTRIGFYVDGILLHQPEHTLEGTDLIGSASVFNPALTQSLDVYTSAYVPRFGDSSAGVVDVHLRDPDSDRYTFTSSANLGAASFAAGGPLTQVKACGWMAGYRKSFIQYLLAKELSDSSMAFGISDGEGRLVCRISDKNSLSFDAIDSFTSLNRSSARDQLGINELMLVHQHAAFENLGWQFTPIDTVLVSSHVALQRDTFYDQDLNLQPLSDGRYNEWTANTDLSWTWDRRGTLSAGLSGRELSETGVIEQYDLTSQSELVDRYRGSGALQGAYVHQSWSWLRDRMHVSAGVREDHHWTDGVTAWSPQASVQLRLQAATELLMSWGEFTQFPEMSQLGSNLGRPTLLPARSIQSNVALQQHFGDKTKLRVEFYNRQDRDLLFQPGLDPRMLNGAVVNMAADPQFKNSLGGYGRGVETYLERGNSHGWSGWVSYAYGHSQMHDGVTGDSFPSDYDQRHTANGFLMYQIRKSVTISSRWTYGSGYPIPGYFALNPLGTVSGTPYLLSEERNQLRLPPYQRLDLRVNKQWGQERKGWRKTLYVEVTNVTNKTNERFGSFEANYGRLADLSLDTMFPILPTVGVVFAR